MGRRRSISPLYPYSLATVRALNWALPRRARSDFERLDLSTATPEVLPLPVVVKSNSESFGGLNYAWSPEHDRLLLSQYVFANDSVLAQWGKAVGLRNRRTLICDPVTASLSPARPRSLGHSRCRTRVAGRRPSSGLHARQRQEAALSELRSRLGRVRRDDAPRGLGEDFRTEC